MMTACLPCLLPWLACWQFWRHLARSWAYPLMGMGDD